MTHFSRLFTILTNIVIIMIIVSIMDPSGHQLVQSYWTLHMAAGLLGVLTISHLVIFINDYILEPIKEEPVDPIMPELRRRDWTNSTIERLKKDL